MSTLLPSSSVNTMSSDDEKCFQCQELGHMACCCPHIRCFDCNNYGHVTANCPDKFHHQAFWQETEITILTPDNVIDPHLKITIVISTITVTIKTGTGLAGPDPIPVTTDTGVTVAVTHEEVAVDPITDPHTAAHHTTEAQAHIITDETPHTADPHHAEVSPETTVDLDLIQHTNTTTKHQQDHLPALVEQPGKPRTGNISR